MITTQHHPDHDTVLYDGRCRFCRSQIALMRRLDLRGRLAFTSLHDPSVATSFPELTHDDLLAQMYVVSRTGQARGGAEAVRTFRERCPCSGRQQCSCTCPAPCRCGKPSTPSWPATA
jgi:Uncharacterized protein conserved in bacteria